MVPKVLFDWKDNLNIDYKKICIVFFGSGPPTPKPYQRPPHPAQNHSYGQYYQQKPIKMDRYQCLKLFYSHGGSPSPPTWGHLRRHPMPPVMSFFDNLV